MGLLENRVCIISGGAGSIGLATARLYLAHGAKVMLLDRDPVQLEAAHRACNSDFVMSMALDVTDAQAVREAFAATAQRWGAIDVIVSNAGNAGRNERVENYPADIFDLTLSIHAKGAFLACKYGAPLMKDGGSIIITSSVAGVRGGTLQGRRRGGQ